jgi:hypothetical protein
MYSSDVLLAAIALDHGIAAAAGHDGLQHVKRKALCYLSRDARRNGEHHPADHRINHDWSVMGECTGNAALYITWNLQPDPAHANGWIPPWLQNLGF